MSKFIRDVGMAEYFMEIDVAMFRRLQRAGERMEPIDTKIFNYLKRKLGK